MRCKNCGWPNQPGETHCVKCGAPLSDNGEMNAADNYPQQNVSPNLKKTVLDASPFADPMPAEPAANVQSGDVCAQCGFPLRPGAVKCPKCGAPVNGVSPAPSNKTIVSPADYTPQADIKSAAFKNFKATSGTVNPYVDGFDVEPICILKPIKRSNERKELESLELDGAETILKRSNTDPDNVTIATETQAVITHEGDKWFITDKSETHTTFVRASGKIELENGSIVLLGNRLFEFQIQK